MAQIQQTADETTLREIKEQLQEKREVLKRLDEEILEIISGDEETMENSALRRSKNQDRNREKLPLV